MSWGDTLQTLAGVVIGGGVTLASDYLLDGRRDRREAATHERDRAEAFRDRRVEFELDTLIKLHGAFTAFLRANTRFHDVDLKIAKDAGRPYGTSPINDPELNEAVRQSNVELNFLLGLVLDDDLRDLIKRNRQTWFKLSYGEKPVEEAEVLLHAATVGPDVGGADILERISERIRELYAAGL